MMFLLTAAAVCIATPISEFAAVTAAKVAATGKAPNPKTPAGASVSSKSIWPNIEVSIIDVEP